MAKIKTKSSKTKMTTGEEIKSIAHHVSDTYHAYQKQFNTGLLIGVVVIAAVFVYSMIKAGQEKSAGVLLETAYATFTGSGSSGPNYDKALLGFQEVVKQYKSTVNGAIAQFYIGNTLQQMGKTEDALKAYQEYAQRYSGEKFVLGLVYQRMGYAYASLGKEEDSVKAFRQAETISGTGVATLELARIYEQSGKMKEAMDKYKELAEKIPATTWAMAARSKLPPPDISAPKSAPAATPK